MRVAFAGVSYIGGVRDRNEDVIFGPHWVSTGSTNRPTVFDWDTKNGPFIAGVVDGMGGHPAGGVAAQLLATTLSQCADTPVARAIRDANRLIYAEAERHRDYAEMGATIAGVVVESDSIQVFNVGDSRVYQQLDDIVIMVTTDDREVGGSGALTQSVGGAPVFVDVDPHISFIAPTGESRFLICSDGLSNTLPVDELHLPVEDYEAPLAVQTLLNRAIERGAVGNVSICVVDVVADSEPLRRREVARTLDVADDPNKTPPYGNPREHLRNRTQRRSGE